MMNKKRFPMNGTFELTGRCNLGCKMCLVRVDCERMKELNLRERTAEEWIDMAEQIRDAGTLGLLLTGGEAMLRPDFCEIYDAIAQMGFVLTLYTNATIVTERVMQTLRKRPPHKIGVTMYGASNETYQRLCGCADGYDRFVDGVEQLSSLPSLFETRTTIVQDNADDLPAMQRFTKERFGADKRLTISRFVAEKIRGGVACPKQCRLTPERNVDLIYPGLSELVQKMKSGEIPRKTDVERLKMRHALVPDGHYLFEHCNAGIDSYAISWSGRMYACELLNDGCTQPFETGFQDAWEHLPEQYPLSRTPEQCRTCTYAGVCESCPANRLAETGDWFGIPEYTCCEAKYLYQLLSEIGAV